MITIRAYQPSDFGDVLGLLGQTHDLDPFTETLLREKLEKDPDQSPETTLVACRQNKLAGFMQGVSRDIRGETYGYIKLMATAPSAGRQGVATKLLKTLEKRFIQRSVGRLRIYDVPMNYLNPGIDPRYTAAVCFAERRGFKKTGEALNMRVYPERSLWDTAAEEASMKRDGILIARAEPGDRERVMEFLDREWALWKYEAEMALDQSPPALFLATKGNSVVAFAGYDGNNQGTGWFGPMGTDPSMQGRGIGRILLYRCLRDMKEQGCHYITIPWVDPVFFYAHHAGARIDRVFWRYEKELQPGTNSKNL